MASTYLNRTLGSGNTDKWTFSCWVKRHNTGVIHPLLHADDNSSNYYTHISFHDTDQLFFQNRWNNGNDGYKITSRMFRDTSAWYHLQFVWDSGNATADDRQIIYVNGERLTQFGGANVAVTQNRNTTINDAYEHRIGRGDTGFNSSQYADITLTHVHFADGQAYAPTVFGETDSTSGIWKPKTAPSVTYGTNGFFLKFENSGAMGTDSSGNTNTFTPAGTLTQNVDTPSNVFAVMNPLAMGTASSGLTFSNGDLTSTNSSSSHRSVLSTLAVSTGKWYYEGKSVTTGGAYPTFGIFNIDAAFDAGTFFTSTANGYGYNSNGHIYHNNGSLITGLSTWTDGDIIGIALDATNNKLYISKNGSWQNSGDPSNNTGGISITSDITWCFAAHLNDAGTNPVQNYNFGQGFFGTTAVASANADANGHGAMEYAVPTGFYTLCTKNIKEFG